MLALSIEALNFAGNLLWVLLDDLIGAHLSADAFCLVSKVKAVECFLIVGGELRDAANYGSLGMTCERGLQNACKLGVPKVYVLEVLGAEL